MAIVAPIISYLNLVANYNLETTDAFRQFIISYLNLVANYNAGVTFLFPFSNYIISKLSSKL